MAESTERDRKICISRKNYFVNDWVFKRHGYKIPVTGFSLVT